MVAEPDTLEILLEGAWWLLLGIYITQFGKAFRWATLLLGAFSLLDGLGEILELKAIAEIGLNVYLILAPIWAIWLGILIWRSAKKDTVVV